MAIDPNFLISPILPGYVYQGAFYPVDSAVRLGYWYQNVFYGPEWLEAGYDFTQTADACLYSCSQNVYQQLPYGSMAGYSYLQTFYKTYIEAQAYQFHLFQEYQKQLAQARFALQSANVDNPATHTPPSNEHALQRTWNCSICSQKHVYTDCMVVLGRRCCLKCLKRKYECNELYCETKTDQIPWSPEIVYNVHKALREHLLLEEQIDPNKEISLPLDSYICIGRNKEAMPGYPSRGHIVGKANLCTTESCPNAEHQLCLSCAARLSECPACGQFIGYEQPRSDEYHPECNKNAHGANFDVPCCACNKKATRWKVRPGVQKEGGTKEKAGKQ